MITDTETAIFLEKQAAAQNSTKCRRRACVAIAFEVQHDHPHGFTNRYLAHAVNGSSWCTANYGACGCIHAEAALLMNLILGLGYKRRLRQLVLITTFSPCVQCAALIAHSDMVSEVYYQREYDADPAGIHVLRSNHILVQPLPPLRS